MNKRLKTGISFISYVIGYIIFCGALELALRGHRDGDDSLNPGIFKGLVNFSAQLDTSLREHLISATVFKGRYLERNSK